MPIPQSTTSQIQINDSQTTTKSPPNYNHSINRNGPNMIVPVPTDPQQTIHSVLTNLHQQSTSPTYYNGHPSVQVTPHPISSLNGASQSNSVMLPPTSTSPVQQNGYNGAANSININENGLLATFQSQCHLNNGAGSTWPQHQLLPHTPTNFCTYKSCMSRIKLEGLFLN